MTTIDQMSLDEMYQLYDQYGKPFEQTHWGQYIVITKEGRTTVGATMVEATENSIAAFGRGNYLFKIGQRAIKT